MAINKKQTQPKITTLAVKTMNSKSASQIAKSLSASALAQTNTNKQISAKMETIASKVLTDPFTNEKIELQNGQLLTLFSDGVIDQFNKSTNKKLGVNNLLAFFQQQTEKDIEIQADEFKKFIADYKKDIEQTDDMVLLCLKFNSNGN
jgi:serine phosphatase RsbU (regulator of sigma subunit)